MTSATLTAATATANKHRHAANSRGVTTLMYAGQQGDVERVKKIVHEQSNILLNRDRTGKTALHYCSSSDKICAAQAADILVMAAPDLVETRDEDGFTPLHLAVIAGNMPLVTFLLANNADVNAVDNEKHTVVHWATVCGETAALRAVLAAGAPVSTPDVHGGYPLHYAAQMCGGEKDSSLGLQVLQTLLTHSDIVVSVADGDGRQPLLWAASAGSAKAVLALIRAGAAVETADKDGLTALHCAASRGHTDCIDSLLTLCGASPDVIDSNGCTALHYAVTLGHADATALLLAHGANPNRQDRKGRTPAHCGCAKGQFETVKMIAAHGANLWLRNARGDLPLHEAAASGRRDLVRWLLDMRPSQVNARNNDGRCPLHLAALNDNSDMCKILLDAGAQVNPVLRTSKNTFMTPLDCALQRGFRSTAKYLQLHGGVPANRLGDHRRANPNLNLQIKDEVTFWGDTSSDSERENGDNIKYNKRIQRKKLVSHKYEKKRASLSGSDPENQKLEKRRIPEKNSKMKINKRTDSAASLEVKKSARVDYTNEVVINDKTEINIHNVKEVNVEQDVKSVDEVANKRPKSAKSLKGKSAKTNSSRKKTKSERPNSKLKSPDKIKQEVTEKIEKTKNFANGTEKKISLEKKSSESPENQKLTDQQSLSNTSEELDEHKSLVVEAAVHEPPKTAETTNEETPVKEVTKITETIDKAVETEDEKISLQSLPFDQAIIKVETEEKGAAQKNSKEENEEIPLVETQNSSKEVTEEIPKSEVQEESSENQEIAKEENNTEKTINSNLKEESLQNQSEEIVETTKLENNLETVDNNSKIDFETATSKKVSDQNLEDAAINDNQEELQSLEPNIASSETSDLPRQNEEDLTTEVEQLPENDQHSPEIHENQTIKNDEQISTSPESNESKTAEDDLISENKNTEEVQEAKNKDEDVEKNQIQEVKAEIEEGKSKKPKKDKSKKKSSHKNQKSPEDQAYEIIYKTLAAGEDANDATEHLKKKRGKVKSQKTVSEDDYATDLETESSTSTNATVKEHKSFRILDEQEAEQLESKITKSKKTQIKSKSPPKKQRSKSEENKKEHKEKRKKTKLPTPLGQSLSKSDKYLNIPDRKVKSSMESRVPSLPNIHDKTKEPPRSESNMSAPLPASTYSDEEKTASQSESDGEDTDKTSATRRRKFKKRSKTREARSAGSDYESSNVIDSGFEPSPRSSKIPKWKNMTERGVNMTSVTQSIQTNIRRYHLERKIFQHLLDLKRLQIRAGQHNEAILVKRAIDSYHQSCAATVGAGRYVPEDYTFRSFEKFLYLSLRKLQKNGADYLKGLPESPSNPLLCTQSTHRCMHATHAYTGIPCAAYLPKMDHHTIPKIGFTSTQCKPGTGFLPTINPKKAVTLELCHGNDKQVISLPADRLDQNKRYYVTFTVKGADESSPQNDETTNSTGHRHSKSD